MKCFKESVCVFIGLLVCFATATDPDCSNTDSKFACHGNRVLRDVMDHLTEDKPLRLIPGIEVLEVPSISTGRSANEIEDDSVIGRVAKYMSTHEVKIKFPELMEKAEFADVINVAMKSLDDSKMVVEGRKKNKGGMGAIMMMGLMMGKMMAALGMGGIALMAMKALGIAMMALMLSAIIGLKKLTEKHDDGGEQHVYVQAHGGHDHRRRREIDEAVPLPYKAWVPK